MRAAFVAALPVYTGLTRSFRSGQHSPTVAQLCEPFQDHGSGRRGGGRDGAGGRGGGGRAAPPAMPVVVPCNRCGKALEAPPGVASTSLRCDGCGNEVALPAGPSASAPPVGVRSAPTRPATAADDT